MSRPAARRWLSGALLVVAVCAAAACRRHDPGEFVGRWQSSRAETPLHMAANGEWELRQGDGHILQYGVWRYESGKLIWSVRQDGRLIDDPTPVLSVDRQGFSIKERDGSVTTFRRLP